MQTVNVKKAHRTFRDQPVQDVQIIIQDEIPDTSNLESTKNNLHQFQFDAENLEIALINALPGGTYDRLLGAMLQRKASQFIVPFENLMNVQEEKTT